MSEIGENEMASVSELNPTAVVDDLALGELEHDAELGKLEAAADQLLADGVLTPKQAQEDRENIAKARKSFYEMTPEQKKKVINGRVKFGTEMLTSTLPGGTATVLKFKLDHGVLKNRFMQFVPFLDRALVNLGLFGEEVLGKTQYNERVKALNTIVLSFFNEVKQARMEAEKAVLDAKVKFDEEGDVYYEPSVPTPALETEIHIHKKTSMIHLHSYEEFDKLLLLCSWLEWNEVRTAKEIANLTKPLYTSLLSVGRRGYMSYVDLMRMRSEKAKTNQAA